MARTARWLPTVVDLRYVLQGHYQTAARRLKTMRKLAADTEQAGSTASSQPSASSTADDPGCSRSSTAPDCPDKSQ